MELRELSADLEAAVARFEEQEMGIRPAQVSVVVQSELVMVHIKGVLTPSERALARSDAGQAILQRFTTLLFNSGSEPSIRQQVSDAVGREIEDVQATLSPLTGSLVVVFPLGSPR